MRQIEDDRDIPGRPERFEEFKELLDLYSREQGCVLPKQTFLIAGTNGKGSVAKTLETLLLRVHRGVGLFTSPHIVDTVERIRSYEKDLSHDEFIEVFKLIEPYRRKMGLSRFETFTLMMFEAFFGGRVRPRVECAVIEVGVGGRLDPTNAIPHSISVVTSIGRDHEAVLGNSLASIGQEKFGIVSRGNIVVCGRLPAEAAQAKMTASSIAGVRVFDARIFSSHIERSELDPVWVIESPWGQAPLALKGPRAIENTSI
ncbi:MAG TPA: hypothetical protein VM432_10885, partial [Bdellovibrionales bacterium]|nr:hypothetical protein [Bdellovibrionales bacterium]